MRITFVLAAVLLMAPVFAPGIAKPLDESSHVLSLVNEARSRPRACGARRFGPTGPLAAETRLVRAAQLHALDMARNRFFSHTGSDHSDPVRRVARTGYAWRLVGENIAAGHPSAAETVRAWLASPGHCRNIMEPRFSEAGVGRAEGGRHGIYWTLVVAQPLEATPR
jgi:uncharacterized protein YkwD